MSQATDAADIAERYFADPVAYVRDVIGAEPDTWQADVMNDIVGNQRVAVASGHGIGKTALIAWIIHWFITTRPDPQIVVTANTKNQLDSKTWRELAKWNKQALNAAWFDHSATKFAIKDSPDTWFASAIPWTEHNSEAFAGTHEENVLVLFDEASNIAQTIWDVVEGAMTTTGARWVAFGNPTRNTGAFRECFGKFRHRWITRQIDSRTARMVDTKQVQQWVDDYGEDSDFVRVRVRGEFPRAGSNQFISGEDVDNCVAYTAEGFEDFPRIMSVDVARYGDDSSVICIKQGRLVFPLIKHKGIDTMMLASKVVEAIKEWKPAAVVIDGVGVGAGVVDRVMQLGYGQLVTELNGGSRPIDPITYFNKRAEVWGLMRDALHVGMEIPDDRELRDDLIGPEYGFTAKNQIQLEKKEDMKKRGLSSPDCFVAGTRINTPSGSTPIEFIREGDLVTTPKGVRKVVKLWETETNSITTVKFSNGTSLSGKGKHEVFTWDAGWIRLDALSLYNEIESDNLWSELRWKFLRTSFTQESVLGFKAQVGTINQIGRMRRRDFFIGASGLTTLGLYRKAFMSIIKMVIGLITNSTTYRLLRAENIEATTSMNGIETQNSERLQWKLWSLGETKLPNGTAHQKDSHGTENMERKHGKAARHQARYVSFAELNIKPSFLADHDFAQTHVCKKKGTNGQRHPLLNALCAGLNLFLASLGIKSVAPVHVQTVSELPETKVYNLTLDADNVYYANGVLVANCGDALAMCFAVSPCIQEPMSKGWRARLQQRNAASSQAA